MAVITHYIPAWLHEQLIHWFLFTWFLGCVHTNDWLYNDSNTGSRDQRYTDQHRHE